VEDYDVHVVVGVQCDALKAVPRLQTKIRNRIPVVPSLVHAVIAEGLLRAEKVLHAPNAGADLSAFGATSEEVIRAAAADFVRSVLVCAGEQYGIDADLLFNSITALPYEGRAGKGTFILAEPDNPSIDILLRIQDPVGLSNTRAVRKLMEACGP